MTITSSPSSEHDIDCSLDDRSVGRPPQDRRRSRAAATRGARRAYALEQRVRAQWIDRVCGGIDLVVVREQQARLGSGRQTHGFTASARVTVAQRRMHERSELRSERPRSRPRQIDHVNLSVVCTCR